MLGDFVAKIAAPFSRNQFIPDFRKVGIVYANGLRKKSVLRQLVESLSPALDRRLSRLIGLVRAYIRARHVRCATGAVALTRVRILDRDPSPDRLIKRELFDS